MSNKHSILPSSRILAIIFAVAMTWLSISTLLAVSASEDPIPPPGVRLFIYYYYREDFTLCGIYNECTRQNEGDWTCETYPAYALRVQCNEP
jgi:hypothetical protein